MLPHFEVDLYKSTEDLRESTLHALRLGAQLGAKTVSLTGLIPAATNHGLDICKWINGTQDLPMITTGDATRTATVVKSVEGILRAARRNIIEEHAAFVGLGSIGKGTLELIMEVVGHPSAITLCDFYQKGDELESLRDRLLASGYEGDIHIAQAHGRLPEEVYSASLIIGATSIPRIIDVAKLQKDTLLVDYSFPNAVQPFEAVKRLESDGDILFTTGGQLRLSEVVNETVYLPAATKELAQDFDVSQLHALVGRDPMEMTGCVLVSLLTGMEPEIRVTLGNVTSEDSLAHYRHLDKLGISSARLQVDGYFLREESIAKFRERRSSEEAPTDA